MSVYGATVAVVLAALCACAGPVAAQEEPVQTELVTGAKVIPNIAGTPRDPQPVRIRAWGRLTTPPGHERPIVTHGFGLLPRAGNYNGDDFPKCSERTLRRVGPDGCPKRSLIGRATGTAYADRVITKPRVQIFNAGSELAWAYVTLYNPALVREPVAVRIRELPRGPWKYKVSVRIPRVLQVVAGVPIQPRSLNGVVGRGNLIETTRCPPNRRWPYVVKLFFHNGATAVHRDSTPCRPAGAARRGRGRARARRR